MSNFRSLKNTFLFVFLTSLAGLKLCFGQVLPGAQNLPQYIPLLKDHSVGLVAHAASEVYASKKATHLVDTLRSHNINIKAIFAPEHGFRSNEDNGAIIKDEVDSKTQIPIISLHGKNRKPNQEQLKDISMMVFDLQDVGVRFYTYLSTLHLVMEACAENNIPLLILDRPNPNGHYVDGPIMEEEYKSFLGMHSVPIVHGLTLGEFAQMINGEGWLNNNKSCDLKIIKIENYHHQTHYELPVRPSPNLPNTKSINLYPSLCLFEQTPVSIGRGTEMQFQIIGHPNYPGEFTFTPHPNFGQRNPKHKGLKCYGIDLREHSFIDKIELKWLIDFYQKHADQTTFFSPYFVKLSGTKSLENQIKMGWSESQIRESWEPQLTEYKLLRKKYLLYED